MRHSKGIGRLGGLALGLGIGAALAALAGNAAAASLGSAAADPFSASDLNVAISIDGMTLVQDGSATATSGTGDLAIAFGADSQAIATGGTLDSAFADGVN